jgi:hypothetical protein
MSLNHKMPINTNNSFFLQSRYLGYIKVIYSQKTSSFDPRHLLIFLIHIQTNNYKKRVTQVLVFFVSFDILFFHNNIY